MPHSQSSLTRFKGFKRSGKKAFNRKQVKAIKKIVTSQAEMKFVDSVLTFTSLVASTVNSHELPQMAQGDTESTRDGDRVRLKKWKIRSTLAIVEAGKDGALVRIFLLRLPAVNVDGGTTLADFNGMTVNSFYPRDIPYKYRIMHDKVYHLSPESNNTQRQVNITLKLDEQAEFDGTASADLIGSRYVLFATSNHSTASEVSLNGVTRNQYIDM